MKAKKYLITCVCLCMTGVCLESMSARLREEDSADIVINEVCCWNETIVKDASRNFSDYIELYNAREEAVSLQGWYLSDDKDQLDQARLPDLTIEPKGYLLFYANGEDEDEDSLPFRLSSEGEMVFLSDPEGRLVDSVIVPKLRADTVYARKTDGHKEWARMEPSPEESNEGHVQLKNVCLEEPVFSREGGFYEEPFWLEITARPGETIYYTLDGREPTEESEVYSGRIYIDAGNGRPNVYNAVQNVVADWKNYVPSEEPADKAVVVRAMVMDGADRISETVTATYFIDLEVYENTDVLSVVADTDELFGEDGIYVTGKAYDDWYLSGGAGEEPVPNYYRTGRRSEIKGNIELFESGGGRLNQRAGVRIQGASSRKFPKKRFSIYARPEYNGSVYFDTEIFEGRQIHSFKLSEGFANAVVPYLLTDRKVATLEARPAVVFLNGEYWYTTYIQDKYNHYFLNEKYGIKKDEAFIIKELDVAFGNYKNIDYYLELIDFFEGTDFTTEEAYEEACRRIDMQSYIDFMCANVYLCNMDMTDTHNYTLWRTYEDRRTEYGDGRWRWMIYDLDFVGLVDLGYFGVGNHAEINAFTTPMQYSGHQIMDEMLIFASLRYNEAFKRQFVLTFMDMANTNFSEKNVEAVFREFGEDLHWHDDFFLKRFDYATEDLAEEFDLQGMLEELTIEQKETDAGYVQVNTCRPDLSEGTWTGRYYTDYPVTVTAAANEGWRFAGWRGDQSSTDGTLSVSLENGAVKLEALFEKTEN